jgi:hypothetical protein
MVLPMPFGGPVNTGVEAVGKPPNFDFSCEKVLGFQGSIFSKESFSTASLDLSRAKQGDFQHIVERYTILP